MSLASGTRLGPYEILAPVGAGGMGEVYRARDPRLGRDVALKVLPAAVAADAERLARFEREARTVAALNHPNIVTLFSIEEATGIRFITMELVEGEPLDRMIVAGGLPAARVVDIAISLAEALVAAHARGIVHRDLKPANVMVTADGRVKVLDFGLAKTTTASVAVDDITSAPTRTDVDALTTAGLVVGTDAYMAPEQIRGQDVDARTDLFAFGIVVYQLATGERPFNGATRADLQSAILRDMPPPLETVRHDLPHGLDSIVRRCLEKSPAARFAAAGEVRDALRQLRDASRHHGTDSTRAHAADEPPSIAVLPFANMSTDPENEFFSDGLTEELLNVLAKVPRLKVTGRTSSFAFKGKQVDLRDVGRTLGVATLLEGSVRRAGNRVRITAQLVNAADGFHVWSETYDRVVDDIFAVQDDIARAVSAALHVKLLGAGTTPAAGSFEIFERILRADHFTRHNTADAVERAATLYREVLDSAPNEARAWAGLARAEAQRAFYGLGGDMRVQRESARTAARRAVALDPALAEPHVVLAWILAAEFRWEESLAELVEAHRLAPGNYQPLASRATFEAFFGRFDKARGLVHEAIALDPLASDPYEQLGHIEWGAGRREAARDALVKALELSPGRAALHAVLGLIELELGRVDEAMAEIAKEQIAGYRDYALAIAYHAIGRRDDSDAALARLIASGEEWAFQIACVQAERGESDEAFRWLDRAYDLHDPGLPAAVKTQSFHRLHADPRWNALLKKLRLVE